MASPTSIRTLEVVLTASCNLRCSYCYQNAKQARHMAWSSLEPALDLVVGSTAPECRVVFIGGEPLLRLPLIERAVAYLSARRTPPKRTVYSLVTNGVLLDEGTTRFLVAHDVQTHLSFDGLPEAQDFRGKGTFEKLDRLLDRLRTQEADFFAHRLHVGMTIHSGNLHRFADSVAYFLEKGVCDLAATPLATQDVGWNDTTFDELGRQFERIVELSLVHRRRTGITALEMFRGQATSTPRPNPTVCGAGRGDMLAVDVDGQVSGCVTFSESYQRFENPMMQRAISSMRMGHVASPGLADAVAQYPAAARATGLFHQKRDKFSSYQRCGDCRFIDDCAVCPTSIGLAPGNDDPRRVPDPQCAFQLVGLAARERFQQRDGDRLRKTRPELLAPRPRRRQELLDELRAWVSGSVDHGRSRVGPQTLAPPGLTGRETEAEVPHARPIRRDRRLIDGLSDSDE